MNDYALNITEDEAVVLFEFFHRFDESDKLEFTHSAEYIALMKIAGQIDRTSPAFFDQEYESLLGSARQRIAEGFEGEVPGMKGGT
jgi:hypothetical protein